MEQNNSDEIDLGIVFSKIKNVINNLLISIYHGIQFLIKHWWKLIIVAIVGAVIGYFLDKNDGSNKYATFIVQNNFSSTNYVYEAVDQLNRKIKEKDSVFLTNAGFRTDTIVLKQIVIEPMVNMVELLNKSKDNYRTLETYLEQTKFKDELLSSELFLSEYKYHKIYISTSSNGTQKDVENVIKFLNNNDVFNNIREIIVEESKDKINHLKETIKKIDAILESQSILNQENKKSSQLIVSNGADYTDFFELINNKNKAIDNIIKIEIELTKYDNVIKVINKPVLVKVSNILLGNKLIIPFIFVLCYIMLFVSKHFYLKIKQLSEEN